MKEQFHSYYRSSVEMSKIWKECVFFIDASALLDLYRFPGPLRDSVLQIFSKLRSRIWLPHQCALEYQDNRVAVIIDQESQYEKVRERVMRYRSDLIGSLDQLSLPKRHSQIDPSEFIRSIEFETSQFCQTVEQLYGQRPKLLEHDTVREDIDSIFAERIGPAPASQKELDAIYAEGKVRFERAQPPGFNDRSKGRPLVYEGMVYLREYGDLVIWRQMIALAKQHSAPSVIFITQDNKDDWWDVVKGERKGPRRELVEEIRRDAGVMFFQLQTIDRFMKNVSGYLDVPVDQGAINQASDIQEVTSRKRGVPRVSRERVLEAMALFDASHRQREEWDSFPSRKHWRHHYTILSNGKNYPVKEIISLASNVPSTDFSGGDSANRMLRQLGFDIVEARGDDLPVSGDDNESEL